MKPNPVFSSGCFPILTAVALSLLVTPRGVVAQEIGLPEIPYEKYTLENGLEVILHEDHSTPVVAVNVWYHVGSKNEKPGKTGFAHLFEHMMFQGSEHHDTNSFVALEDVGGTDLNGTTNWDRTNYFETVPSNALEMTLWLEADRMGWLLPAMTQERFDNQREVVKNERRQRIENQPYGLVSERMWAALYPSHHPYSWTVIGSMDDLSAASKGDVETFFRSYYGPNNSTLVIAGDIDVPKTKALVDKYFGPIPPGPPVYRMREWIPELSEPIRLSMEDRVSLPRLYIAWLSPARFKPGEIDLIFLARILSRGKASRLYKRLVYDLKVAQDVVANHHGREIAGLFNIVVTAGPGHTLDEIEPLVLEELEKLKSIPPTEDEVELVRTGFLTDFVRALERVGQRSDFLATYNTYLDDPGYLEKAAARIRSVTPASVQAAARRWLHEGRVVMRVTPFPELAAREEPEAFDRAVKPALGASVPLRLPELQRAQLSNGLEVVLAESHKVPVVQLILIVRGGWSADSKDTLGVASFMSRVQDEATKTRTALEINAEAKRLGAYLAANSDLDYCWVGLNAVKPRLKPSVKLWADVILNPVFPEEEIKRQREQVLGQILQEKQDPAGLAFRILPGLLYGWDHPYGQPFSGSGTEATVKAITRRDLVEYHGTWFKPNNATLIAAGDTTLEEIVLLLENAFRGWDTGNMPRIEVLERKQPAQTKVYLIDKPEAAQSVLLAGHLLPPRNNPKYPAFQVLNTVLGGQFNSRLNMNLREDKGYTYGVGSGMLDARGQGVFMAFSAVRTDVTRESIAEVMKELRDIRGPRPVSPEEMRLAQNNLTLSLPGQHETVSRLAEKVFEIVMYGLPEDYFSTYPDKVRGTTVEDLIDLANERILPDNLLLVVIGDRTTVENDIKELKLGPVEYLDRDGRPLSIGSGE